MSKQQELPTGQFADDGSVDADFLNMLAAEAIEYIHKDATEPLVDVLTNTENTAEAIGAASYKITKGLLDRHKPEAVSLEADMSHALALGAEVTDMLIEVTQAANPEANLNVDAIREEALMRATVMHGEEQEAKGDEDAKEEAQIMFAQMMQDGTVDAAFAHVDQKQVELGVNPQDTLRQGYQLGTGYMQGMMEKSPLSKGIEQARRNMEKTDQDPDAVPPADEQYPKEYGPNELPPDFRGLAPPRPMPPPTAEVYPETEEEVMGMIGEPVDEPRGLMQMPMPKAAPRGDR